MKTQMNFTYSRNEIKFVKRKENIYVIIILFMLSNAITIINETSTYPFYKNAIKFKFLTVTLRFKKKMFTQMFNLIYCILKLRKTL